MMESILVTIPFGDMIHYLSGYTAVLLGFAAVFVFLAAGRKNRSRSSFPDEPQKTRQ